MQAMHFGSNPKDNFATLRGKMMKMMGFTWNSATSTWTNTTSATNRDALLEVMRYTYNKHTSTWTNGTVAGLNLTIVAEEVIEKVESVLHASMSGTATTSASARDPTRTAENILEVAGWGWNRLVSRWAFTGQPARVTPAPLSPPASVPPAEPQTSN